MEIEVYKYNNSNTKQGIDFLKIDKLKVIVNNPDLLLVRDGKMEVDSNPQNRNVPFLEIYKVQFIAACENNMFENEVIVAFYIGEYAALTGHVLSGLPDNYYTSTEQMYLVDYSSYLEICELTGESKLSFSDYFNEIKSGKLGVNTLLSYNEEHLNYDNQKELWKKIDGIES